MIYLFTCGGSSSMAEHLIVDPVVEGSSPFYHPLLKNIETVRESGLF